MTKSGRSLEQLLEDLPVMKLDLLHLALNVARERGRNLPAGPEQAENDQWIEAMEAELANRAEAGPESQEACPKNAPRCQQDRLPRDGGSDRPSPEDRPDQESQEPRRGGQGVQGWG